MPNNFNINHNDLENGYIYRELTNRLNIVERNLESIYNNLKVLGNPSNINNILDELEKRAMIDYVDDHIHNQEIHLNDIKKMLWDNKYDRPTNGIPESDLDESVRDKINNVNRTGVEKKTFLIGNNSSKIFSIIHNFGREGLYISIKDTVTNEYVLTSIKEIDENNIQINFNMIPQNNQFLVTIIG